MDYPLHRMQYLVPPGFPAARGKLDRSVADLGASLKGVDTKGASVPNSALWLKLNVFLDGSSLEIKKRGKLVYINIFCVDGRNVLETFSIVEGLYEKYSLGRPNLPIVETWIHSIPIPKDHSQLRDNEILLCEKLTVSFYWAVYAQWHKKHNPHN